MLSSLIITFYKCSAWGKRERIKKRTIFSEVLYRTTMSCFLTRGLRRFVYRLSFTFKVLLFAILRNTFTIKMQIMLFFKQDNITIHKETTSTMLLQQQLMRQWLASYRTSRTSVSAASRADYWLLVPWCGDDWWWDD